MKIETRDVRGSSRVPAYAEDEAETLVIHFAPHKNAIAIQLKDEMGDTSLHFYIPVEDIDGFCVNLKEAAKIGEPI